MEATSQTISFCDELRKAREYQGLSLAEIALQTRIPKEYLEALEDGKLDIIPQPIQRGVISAYAKAAQMNSEKVLRTLEELQGIRSRTESGLLSPDRSSRESMTVGMTRAQIRTAWFASIADNRLLHWGLTVLLLLVGVMLAAQWRAGGQQTFLRSHSLSPVGEPVSSFRASPWQEVKEAIPDSLRYKINFPLAQCVLTALDTAEITTMWGLDQAHTFDVYPHDKINFIHYSGLRIGSQSGFRGVIIAETDTFQTHFAKDSITTWLCYPDEIPTNSSGSSAKADSVRS